MKRDYYTSKSLAEHLELYPGTLVKWRTKGWGPRWITLESGTIRYPAEWVEEWLEQRKHEVSVASK